MSLSHPTPVEPRPGAHRSRRSLRRRVATLGVVAVLGTATVVGAAATHAGGAVARATAAPWSQPTQQSAPVRPFGDGSGRAPDAATEGAEVEASTDATAEQSVGLVEITSTLASGQAAGTGMVLTSDGLVVTNHHVVEGATALKVTVVSTGGTYDAQYVGGDASADVAVIRLVGASGLTAVDLGDDAAAVGDTVTAVGDAGGDGGSLTASAGTVQALDQDITVTDESTGGASSLTGLVQLAARVVPGDSGGAVLDADGEVVGMNVAASTTGTTGYAIPLDTVEEVVEQIVSGATSSTITRGYAGVLGVTLGSSTPQVAGVSSDSAAESAGLVAGDTITAVDGATVSTFAALAEAVGSHAAGDRVTISWTTAQGQQRSATVTLGQGGIA